MRETKAILSDINTLVRSKGYIYSLCMLILEDFHYDVEHLHEVNYREHVGFQEVSLLVGCMLHEPIDFSYPEHPKELLRLKSESNRLLSELENTLIESNHKTIKKAIEDSSGLNATDNNIKQLNFFIKEGSITESIIYAKNTSNVHPYNNALKLKYQDDEAWMAKNCGFTIPQALQVIDKIQQNLAVKFRHFYSFMVKNNKSRTKEFNVGPDAWQIDFYPYLDLFNELEAENKETDISKMSVDNWYSFYKNLLFLFTVKRKDLGNEDFIESFLNKFTTDQVAESNRQFEAVGDFNFYRSQPILLLEPGGDDYFIPLTCILYEILYEAPKNWMLDDKGYQETALKHLSDFGHTMCNKILSRVYYPDQMYPNATITDAKGESTQIDILCVIANKALCVQIQSEKVTDITQYNNDKNVLGLLKSAIQDVQKCADKQKRLILSGAKITDKDGLEIKLEQPITEVELMGVTTKNCPTITQQAYIFMDKSKKDSYPLFTSIFELDILAHYLKNPFTFLYYLGQRSKLSNQYIASEEMAYLGYHLCHSLHPSHDKKTIYIDDEYAEYVNRNFFPYLFGIDGWIDDRKDPIKHRWTNTWFSRICKQIKQSNRLDRVDILFHLYDLSMEGIDRMIKRMRDLKEKAQRDGSQDNASIYIKDYDFGLNYLVKSDLDQKKLESDLEEYCQNTKYKHKAHFWLGFGCLTRSTDAYDAIVYLKEPWKYNKEYDRKISKGIRFFKRRN